jgi:hypothetical protein
MLRSHRIWVLSAACLAAVQVGVAQDSRGSILGKVTDPQAAVVPSAAVLVTNTSTNVVRRRISG